GTQMGTYYGVGRASAGSKRGGPDSDIYIAATPEARSTASAVGPGDPVAVCRDIHDALRQLVRVARGLGLAYTPSPARRVARSIRSNRIDRSERARSSDAPISSRERRTRL